MFARMSPDWRAFCMCALSWCVRYALILLAMLLVWPAGLRAAPAHGVDGEAHRAAAPVQDTIVRSGVSPVQDTIVERVIFQVLDDQDQPLANAEVFVVELERRLLTNAAGLAFLEQVPVGIYGLGVRRVGYLPSSLRVQITPLTSMITLPLEPVTTRLAAVVSQAERGGLSGVVSDTALRPLAGARVMVVGSGQRTTTNAQGRFHLSLKAAAYMIRIERDSFASQAIGVTVPKDSGRQIAVWMEPAKAPPNPAEAVQLFELGRRMVRLKSINTRYYTRDGLHEMGITDLAQLARRWQTAGISGACEVTVKANGWTWSVPLVSVDLGAIEFVEVSRPDVKFRPGTRGPTSIANGGNRQILTPTGYELGFTRECGYVSLVIWLRT